MFRLIEANPPRPECCIHRKMRHLISSYGFGEYYFPNCPLLLFIGFGLLQCIEYLDVRVPKLACLGKRGA